MPSRKENQERAQSHFEKSEQQKADATKSRHDYHAQINADVAKTARLRALRLAKEAAEELAKTSLAVEKQTALKASPKATRKKPVRKARLVAEP